MLTIVPRKWALLREHNGMIWTHSAAGHTGSISTELGPLWRVGVPLFFAAPFIIIYHALFVRPMDSQVAKDRWDDNGPFESVEEEFARRRRYN